MMCLKNRLTFYERYKEALVHSCKECFGQVRRSANLVVVFLCCLIFQSFFYAEQLSSRCLFARSASENIFAEVLEVSPSVDGRSAWLGLRLSSNKKVFLRFANFPWSKVMLEPGVFLKGRLSYKPICAQQFFSYPASLLRKGYRFISYDSTKLEVLSGLRATFAPFRAIRESLLSEILREFDLSDELAILLASTIAEKAYLSEDTNSLFRKTGTSHLLVVSGYHISLVFFAVFASLQFVFKRLNFVILNVPVLIPAGILAVFVSALYTALVSGAITAMRAFFSLFVFVMAKSFGRRVDSFRVFMIVAIVVISSFPGSFFEPGVQLSFAAIFGILFGSSFLSRLKERGDLGVLALFFLSAFILSLAASVFTWPIIYFWFGSFSPLSPIYNAVFAQIFSFVVIAMGDLALIFYYFSPVLSEDFLLFVLFLTKGVVSFLEFLS